MTPSPFLQHDSSLALRFVRVLTSFFPPPPVFVSRSDISADGQAMTAANGSRALSPVSLATAGRENRTCQMENVNYSGCGGERCCEQRRRAAGGAPRRRAAQWRAGWGGARQRRPGKQRRDDKIMGRHGLSGGGLHRFAGSFARQSPFSWPTGWLTSPPPTDQTALW